MPSSAPIFTDSIIGDRSRNRMDAFGLEVEAEEDSESDDEGSSNTSSNSETISSERTSHDEDPFSSSPDDSDEPLPPSPSFLAAFHHDRERKEMLDMSVAKLRCMSQERGVENSLRKSVLIFNTMRCLQLTAARGLLSPPAHHLDIEDDDLDDAGDFHENGTEIPSDEEPDNQSSPFARPPFFRQIASYEGSVDDALESNAPLIENDDPDDESGEAGTYQLWPQTPLRYPSGHIYPSVTGVEEEVGSSNNNSNNGGNLLLCQQRSNSGDGWQWSLNSEVSTTQDSSYIRLSSNSSTSGSSFATTLRGISPDSDEEAMDTSESPPPTMISPPPSIFSSIRSELAKSFHILNPQGATSDDHPESGTTNLQSTDSHPSSDCYLTDISDSPSTDLASGSTIASSGSSSSLFGKPSGTMHLSSFGSSRLFSAPSILQDQPHFSGLDSQDHTFSTSSSTSSFMSHHHHHHDLQATNTVTSSFFATAEMITTVDHTERPGYEIFSQW